MLEFQIWRSLGKENCSSNNLIKTPKYLRIQDLPKKS